MKKILLTLLFCFSFTGVVKAETCSRDTILELVDNLSKFSYELVHVDNMIGMEGEKLDGYFEFRVSNLPSGFLISIPSKNIYYIDPSVSTIYINGGAHKVIFYNQKCDNAIKEYEFFVPFYKAYCGTDDCAKTGVWFDGTFENIETKTKEKKGFSYHYVVILVVLIIIIVNSAIIFIRRRRSSNEKI